MRSTIAAVTMLTALPLPAHAEWKPAERIETYAISGTSGIELYRSIGDSGPKVGIGRAIAYTSYDLKWSRDYRPEGGGCTLASAKPHLTIIYRLPKPAGKLPPGTARLWRTFIAGVEKHERVHGRFILDTVKKIEAASVGLRVEDDSDCSRTRAELQRRLVPLAEELRQRSRDFDSVELRDGGNVHRLVLDLVNGQ